MGLFDHFPYTNVHELNLDWVLRMMKALEAAWEQFTAGNSLTFADPLQHDISKTYAKNTIVIDGSGNAYVSLQAVPVGVGLGNQDYWLMVFNYEAFIEKVNKNFTARYYRGQYRATAAMVIGDWLTVDDVLCKATAAIAADDVLEVGVNIEHFTLEDFIKAFMTSANQLIQQYKNDIDASELLYRQQLAQDIANTTASLQAQLDAAISGATVDSEVINARVGADGVTYPTLGDAIRIQITNAKDFTILIGRIIERGIYPSTVGIGSLGSADTGVVFYVSDSTHPNYKKIMWYDGSAWAYFPDLSIDDISEYLDAYYISDIKTDNTELYSSSDKAIEYALKLCDADPITVSTDNEGMAIIDGTIATNNNNYVQIITVDDYDFIQFTSTVYLTYNYGYYFKDSLDNLIYGRHMIIDGSIVIAIPKNAHTFTVSWRKSGTQDFTLYKYNALIANDYALLFDRILLYGIHPSYIGAGSITVADPDKVYYTTDNTLPMYKHVFWYKDSSWQYFYDLTIDEIDKYLTAFSLKSVSINTDNLTNEMQKVMINDSTNDEVAVDTSNEGVTLVDGTIDTSNTGSYYQVITVTGYDYIRLYTSSYINVGVGYFFKNSNDDIIYAKHMDYDGTITIAIPKDAATLTTCWKKPSNSSQRFLLYLYMADRLHYMTLDVADAIKTLMDYNKNAKYCNISYITDTHANTDNNSIVTIDKFREIVRSDVVDMGVHGGDLASSNNYYYGEYIRSFFRRKQAYCDLNDMLFVLGNHENNYDMRSGTPRLTRTQQAQMMKTQVDVVHDPSNPLSLYYYYDFDYEKVRLIVLNALDSTAVGDEDLITFSNDQLNWLETVLNSTTSDWSVIVFAHYYDDDPTADINQMINAFANKTTDGNYSYDDTTGKFVAWIHGHNHQDEYDNTLGFNVIGVRYGGDIPSISQYGGFSIFTINTTTANLYETRVGDGPDRQYTYGKNNSSQVII